MTGFQEAEKFAKHLSKCKKRPATATANLQTALRIRHDSGQ
jgi:hypothetical protein